MSIETIIKDMFAKDVERVEIPQFSHHIPVPQRGGKQKERHGFLIATIVVSALLSLFLSQTGVFKSALVVPWADMMKLLPENPAEAFLYFLQAINSSV
jgi:hypothetical protein